MRIQLLVTDRDALLPTSAVRAEMQAIEDGTQPGNGEFSDTAARTVASWWQSPGTIGSVLSALASGLPVGRDELLDDISATAREAMSKTHPGWPRELEMLSTWVINHD